MGRSPSITIGDELEGVRVEHVKSRGLVRLTRRTPGSVKDDAVGLEVSDFCSRLGITTDVLGAARRYLLVGDPARLGAGHVVALFPTEAEAKAEFIRFRRSELGAGAWAEVTEITDTGGNGMRRICWFQPAATATAGRPAKRRSGQSFRATIRQLFRPKAGFAGLIHDDTCRSS